MQDFYRINLRVKLTKLNFISGSLNQKFAAPSKKLYYSNRIY